MTTVVRSMPSSVPAETRRRTKRVLRATTRPSAMVPTRPMTFRSRAADGMAWMSRRQSQAATRSRLGQAGFTLIELLVVLVILGLLAALAGPRVINYLGGAKTDTARLQIENLKSALDLYRLDTGSYPIGQQGLAVLMKNP